MTVGLEIVTVVESQDPVVIVWAKAALAVAGIPFYVAVEEIAVRNEAVSTLHSPLCRIRVTIDREAQARAILEPHGRDRG
jgi:hypothetical protein